MVKKFLPGFSRSSASASIILIEEEVSAWKEQQDSGETVMRKYIIWFAAFCILAGLAFAVAGEELNLSGNWSLDRARSDPPPQMGRGGPGGARGMGDGSLPGRGRMGGGRPGGAIPEGMGEGRIGELTVSIQHTADTLIILRRMGTGENARYVEQHFTLDGSESKNLTPMGNGFVRTTATNSGDVLVIQGIQDVPGPEGDRELRSREEFSLADNGMTLIIKTTRFTPEGEQSFKQFFAKQP
jgi:hypothetical protein